MKLTILNSFCVATKLRKYQNKYSNTYFLYLNKFEYMVLISFLSADSFSFALKGGLQRGDKDEDEEDSFVRTTVMLSKDRGLAWGSRRFLAIA